MPCRTRQMFSRWKCLSCIKREKLAPDGVTHSSDPSPSISPHRRSAWYRCLSRDASWVSRIFLQVLHSPFGSCTSCLNGPSSHTSPSAFGHISTNFLILRNLLQVLHRVVTVVCQHMMEDILLTCTLLLQVIILPPAQPTIPTFIIHTITQSILTSSLH